MTARRAGSGRGAASKAWGVPRDARRPCTEFGADVTEAPPRGGTALGPHAGDATVSALMRQERRERRGDLRRATRDREILRGDRPRTRECCAAVVARALVAVHVMLKRGCMLRRKTCPTAREGVSGVRASVLDGALPAARAVRGWSGVCNGHARSLTLCCGGRTATAKHCDGDAL